MFATIFQCVPVNAYWDKSIKTAKCINSDAFWYAYAIINIVTDVWILALPMPQIRKLQLPRQEKLGVMMVFALGALLVFLNHGVLCLQTVLITFLVYVSLVSSVPMLSQPRRRIKRIQPVSSSIANTLSFLSIGSTNISTRGLHSTFHMDVY